MDLESKIWGHVSVCTVAHQLCASGRPLNISEPRFLILKTGNNYNSP